METLLWLVPTLPLIGFAILALFGFAPLGAPLSRRAVSYIGVGSVGLSALLALLIAAGFLSNPTPYNQTLWTWIAVAGPAGSAFAPGIAFRLDQLSLIMIVVVTFVGFWIHLYSTEYMEDSYGGLPGEHPTDSPGDRRGYARFFAALNLFVSSMLILVLADNLLLLYLGWEGVGLCSYLLIGFWYKDPANGYAARKAFVVTRVGDTAMAIGLFILFTRLGTFNIQDLMTRAAQQWPLTGGAGAPLAIAAAALLLGGAVGKSAQLPLQTWLPDAMAGPTPVSALIHAATMVTAGVYLIARTHVLFQLAPPVMLAVAIVGALTLLIAGFSALTQTDLKRVLAYSTISQIGYMFLALGVGAWSAAVFHLFTHAFFKALLFLGAGVVIHVLHEEHDMFKMGGLRTRLPVTFWTFLIGSASLSALPLVTAGFYSKDLILWHAYASPAGSPWLWAAGLVGAFITSIYTFRMVFITFFGEAHANGGPASAPAHRPSMRMELPLIILAALSIIAGFVELPPFLGNLPAFSNFFAPLLPEPETVRGSQGLLALIAALVALAGIYLAYRLFLQRSGSPQTAPLGLGTEGSPLTRYWRAGWGFDWLYNRLIVSPYVRLAQIDKDDVVDTFYDALAALFRLLNRAFSRTQTGRVRWYALGIALGAVIVIGIVVFL